MNEYSKEFKKIKSILFEDGSEIAVESYPENLVMLMDSLYKGIDDYFEVTLVGSVKDFSKFFIGN